MVAPTHQTTNQEKKTSLQFRKGTHQQDGKILIFDGHFSSSFLTYSTLFCNFSGLNFYKYTT